MENANTILWMLFVVCTFLFWYVGTSFISQPDWNVPPIFKLPVIGKLLVLAPQIGFVAVVILGFFLAENGWWFLGAVIALTVFLPLGHKACNETHNKSFVWDGAKRRLTIQTLGSKHQKEILMATTNWE